MSAEPVHIFSGQVDPAGVVQLLRRLADVNVKGSDDNWSTIEVVTERRVLRSTRKIEFLHNAELYDGLNGRMQNQGMQKYFSRLPDSPARTCVLSIIPSLQFRLSIAANDLDLDSEEDDDRRDVLFAVCHYLNAVIFTPTTLRDASGRILISSTQPSDPEATFPPPDLDREWPTPAVPGPVRVARRALALTAVAARATLELDESKPDDHRIQILEWINDLNSADELEPHERKLLGRRVGSLKEQEFVATMWQVEGLAILVWALNLAPAPAYDKLVIPADVYESIGLFDVEAGDRLLQNPKMRSADELHEMQERLFLFQWRLQRFASDPVPMNLVAYCESCLFANNDLSKFRIKNNDLAIGDSTIAKARPHELGQSQSVATERFRAINWLLDASNVYSQTDTST